MTTVSASHLSGAAGDLDGLAAWLRGQAGAFAGLVGGGESCLADVGAVWGGPRARAALGGAGSYLATQRPVESALLDAGGVVDWLAATARGLADRASTYEAELAAAGHSDEVDAEAMATARRQLSSLATEWATTCATFAGRLDAHAATLETAVRATPDLGPATPMQFERAGWTAGSFGATTQSGVPALFAALASVLPLLGGSVASLLRRAVTALAAARRLLDQLGDAATDEAVDQLSTLPADEAVAYWETLDGNLQNRLVNARPDLVALVVLANDGTLSVEQLDLLERANRYGVFSDEFTVEVEASAGLHVVTINFDGEFSAVATKFSDGSVELLLLVGVGGGIGLEGSAGRVEGEAHGGVYGSAFQVLRFASEEEAAAAVARLEQAAADGLDVFDYAPTGDQTPGTVASTGGPSTVSDLLWPVDELAELISGADELAEQVDDLFDEHGVLIATESGTYVAAEGELDLVGIVEAEVEAELSVGRLTVDAVAGSGEEDRTGVILSGEVLARGDTTGFGAEAQGAFAVEVYEHDDGEQFSEITLQVAADGGLASEIFDTAGVEIDAQATVGGRATITIQLPVTADVLPSLEEVVTGIPGGSIDGVVLANVLDAADVSITVESTETVYTETSFDAAVVAVEVESTGTEATTVVALHKFPGGRMYSRAEVDGLVAEALDE